jgi:peptide/nickel transport system permease protein
MTTVPTVPGIREKEEAVADAVRKGPRSYSWTSRVTLGIAGVVLVLLLLACFAPGIFTSQPANTGVLTEKLVGPGSAHWLGTDQLGRDLYTRIVYGTKISVGSALLAVLVGLITGSVLGLVAAFGGSLTDAVISRVVDVLLAIPSLLLSMAIVASLGFSTIHAAIAVGISTVALFTRLMRAEVLKLRARTFVESSFLIGGGRASVLLNHILPNAYTGVLGLAILEFGNAIVNISVLAFFGYGDPPPSPEWGQLVSDGQDFISIAPWLLLAPAVAIVITVLTFNRLSQAVRERG